MAREALVQASEALHVRDGLGIAVAGDAMIAGEKIVKIFAGKKVLDDIDIRIAGGEIHALLGANGSGKSTLVKILTGVYRPDGGAIRIGERRLARIESPHQANALGIAVVHQEAPLINNFTVAECVAQFRGYPMKLGRIDWKRLQRDVAEMLERYDVTVSPERPAGSLSAAERALVAIVIALDRVKSGLRLLVLDEVTASLPRNQAESYLDHVAALARSGIGVLMVTHRLAELHGRASVVTLLRDGGCAYAGPAGEVDDVFLVTQMISANASGSPRQTTDAGRNPLLSLWHTRDPRDTARTAGRQAALVFERVSGGALKELSFNVDSGEIVGMVGLADAGVADVPRMLAGLERHESGRIVSRGAVIPPGTEPHALIRAGIVVLPADRLQMGGIANLPVAENVLLPDFGRYWHHGARERSVLGQAMRNFDVRPPDSTLRFGSLSGGNQQKAILAKWLLLHPVLLVLDDPTSGVDPGAREKIFELLRAAAAAGVGVLAFSTEPEQLARVCTRVLVLRDGAVVKELAGEKLTGRSISEWCYT